MPKRRCGAEELSRLGHRVMLGPRDILHMGNFKVLTSTEFNAKDKCRILSSNIVLSPL